MEYKFTPKRAGPGRVCFEATCYNELHCQGQKCRRTRTAEVAEDVLIRRLKLWCLQGHCNNGRDDHYAHPDVDDEEVPNDMELDRRLAGLADWDDGVRRCRARAAG